MRENLTNAIEDYLKVIYEITIEDTTATTNQIAERMGVNPASVTGMLKRLATNQPPLLKYQKHHGAILTIEGRQVALEIIRHHRLIELFLQKELGFSWDQVHDEADRLEHVISERLEERISLILGDPVIDPHGEPIPSREFHLPDESHQTRLSDLRPGDNAVIKRVLDTDSPMLRYLASIGLTPGNEVLILDHSQYDDNLRIQIQGQPDPQVLGTRITNQILVSL
jgi:DtxR family Mn-dependent transcriptional regulator